MKALGGRKVGRKLGSSIGCIVWPLRFTWDLGKGKLLRVDQNKNTISAHYCVKMNIIKELFLFLFLQNPKNEEFFSSGH